MTNLEELEAVVERNYPAYSLAKGALEQIRELKGSEWAQYLKTRWLNFGPDYRPKAQPQPQRSSTVWELTQRRAAAEREWQLLDDRYHFREAHSEGWTGTPEQRMEWKRLKAIIRECDRRITNGER